MPCWKCSGTGSYKVTKFYALMNEYRIVQKGCGCGAEKRDFPYEDELMRAKIGGAERSGNCERPLTNVTRSVGGAF